MNMFTDIAADLSRSLKEISGTGLELLQNRLELISLELQEEKYRIISLVIWTALALLFAMMAFILSTFTIVYLLEGQARTIALLCFSIFYVLAAVGSYVVIRVKIRKAVPFSQTMEEMKKDQECF